MTMPGFTAERAAYRTRPRYVGSPGGPRANADQMSPAGNCGYYCNCDVGQCCKVGWGGLTCSCNTCTAVAETRSPDPTFLRA
jgi:hypothetical protein